MGEKTGERAVGHWHNILVNLGFDRGFLTGKNGPCPFCGGKDRWRFSNFEGRGCWVCNQCGKGDGIELVKRFLDVGYLQACARVDSALAHCPGAKDEPPTRDAAARRRIAMRMWQQSKPVTAICPIGRYLTSRRLPWQVSASSVRSLDSAWCDGSTYAAMVAKVISPQGQAITLHRTFLTPDGQKAPIETPRRMMPGRYPLGSAVRLSPAGPIMGIAEGVETAMAAAVLFKMPVWSAITANGLERFVPPAGVTTLHIFADNDLSFTGQAVAYALARRVRNLGVTPIIHIPEETAKDWNDILAMR